MDYNGISNEAVSIFDHIKSSCEVYNLELFMLAILNGGLRNTIAYKVLSSTMLTEDLDSITNDFTQRQFSMPPTKQFPNLSDLFGPMLKKMRKKCDGTITSGDIMIEIVSSNGDIKEMFKKYGVTIKQLENALSSEKKDLEPSPKEKGTAAVQKERPKSATKSKKSPSGDAEKNLINLSEMAENGEIDPAYGNEAVINTIFSVLSKRKYNNVVLVGKQGVGKTTTVRHIANVIANGMCPQNFNEKVVLQMDFSKLIVGTMYKGLFETKFQSIVDDAAKSGKYIFFVDDIDNILSPNTKISDIPTTTMLDLILSNKNIQFICTTTEECYSKYILSDKVLSKGFTKIELKEKTDSEVFGVVKNVIPAYESFHNVAYTDKAILDSISLSKKYIKDRSLPESSIDLLDEAGALVSMSAPENPDIEELKSKVASIRDEISSIENSSSRAEYDRIDELTRRELSLGAELSRLVREDMENQTPMEVNESHVSGVLAKKIGSSPKIVSSDERERLVGLSDRMKRIVIGQDEAVDTIAMAVKRKVVGVSNQEKPIVFLAVGETGCGKTFLAKTLAKELFDDGNNLVRIDMSEYSDKMSVNKLIGSANGYVGYEEGGMLTEAIKRKPRCVLLLDEIEKANDEVFNLFLQVFDEGRLTDNKGVVVNFSNVIVIMTSNVGAREVSEASGRIGFSSDEFAKNDELMKAKGIIRNAIKHKFSPEFLNRIDKIVWFNTLTDEDLEEIIINEIRNVSDRIGKIGYSLSNELYGGKLVKNIFEAISKNREYGARPILREIEEQLEDRITDLIINETVDEGHVFTEEEICQ